MTKGYIIYFCTVCYKWVEGKSHCKTASKNIGWINEKPKEIK